MFIARYRGAVERVESHYPSLEEMLVKMGRDGPGFSRDGFPHFYGGEGRFFLHEAAPDAGQDVLMLEGVDSPSGEG